MWFVLCVGPLPMLGSPSNGSQCLNPDVLDLDLHPSGDSASPPVSLCVHVALVSFCFYANVSFLQYVWKVLKVCLLYACILWRRGCVVPCVWWQLETAWRPLSSTLRTCLQSGISVIQTVQTVNLLCYSQLCTHNIYHRSFCPGRGISPLLLILRFLPFFLNVFIQFQDQKTKCVICCMNCKFLWSKLCVLILGYMTKIWLGMTQRKFVSLIQQKMICFYANIHVRNCCQMQWDLLISEETNTQQTDTHTHTHA